MHLSFCFLQSALLLKSMKLDCTLTGKPAMVEHINALSSDECPIDPNLSCQAQVLCNHQVKDNLF